MVFIEPMHRNKPNITYLLSHYAKLTHQLLFRSLFHEMDCHESDKGLIHATNNWSLKHPMKYHYLQI